MKLIVLEGPDKLGKTTQAKRLCQAIGAEYVKFPNEELYSGRVLREILNKERAFEPVSFQALQIVNRIETMHMLDPAGVYVFDRWTASGEVYGGMDGVDMDWFKDASSLLPEPDLEFIFYGVPFGNDTDIYGEKQEHVRGLYAQYIVNHICVPIEANRDPDEVAEDILINCKTMGVLE